MTEEQHVVSTSSPTVSIITPVRNGDKFLEECLQSIIDQTYTGPMELCVFNDGSTDTTADILRAWEVRSACLKILKILLLLNYYF